MTQASPGGRLVEYYDRRYRGTYMASHSDIDVRRVRELLGGLPRGIRTVLDYGCGRGAWTNVLSEVFPAAAVTGVDISPVAIDAAARQFPGLRFHLVEGSTAPVEASSFDLVFSFHVLEHVDDLDAAADDMMRAARPGGLVCIVMPCGNPGSFEERIVARLGGRSTGAIGDGGVYFYEDPGHRRRLTSHEVATTFEARGASLVSAAFANHYWGAIHWLSHSSGDVVASLFDASRARRRRDRLFLTAYRTAFALLAPLVRAGRAARRQRSRLIRIPLSVGLPALVAVEWLAWREWTRSRERPNGSAHYLVFRKDG